MIVLQVIIIYIAIRDGILKCKIRCRMCSNK
jgi:hypothetical protein